ncbi:ribbon-helix-helix protein, CopG family [bacterium]|nr:ribbon-helix-helix protein, CopG family [bacterium]
MPTTTLTLDDATQHRLEELASARGITPEEIIREALEEKLAPVRRRMPKSLGMGDSGRSDISERMSTEMPELPPWR